MIAERRREKPPRRSGIAPGRDVDVDDLAVLVDGSVDVAPPAGDLHVGLIDVPTIADRMPAGSGRVGEERREALHPPVHRDVIDLDPTLGEEFLDIAIGEPEPKIPAHREDDDLRREPEALERRTRTRENRTTMRSEHPTTVALGH